MADNAAADTYKTLDLAVRVGEMLLSSGAGAADVSAQMSNVAHACGLRRVNTDVTFTTLSMSYQPTVEEPAVIQFRTVRHREIDYGDLTLVDHLVRALIEGNIDRDEARAQLARITSTGHGRPRWTVSLAWGVMGGGVGLMLGGNPVLVGVAFLAAAAIDVLQRKLAAARLPGFYLQVAGGLLGEYIARPVGREAHRLERRLAGPRLVGPLTVRTLRRRK